MRSRREEEGRAREALGQVEVPNEHRAEVRGRQVVAAAFEERDAVGSSRGRTTLRAGIALLTGGVIAALALTPAGADMRKWIAERIQVGEEDAEPRLTSLPAPGAILVETSNGVWTIRDDGSKRRLGDYDEATWSPSGLFVGVTDGSELRAIDPAGNFRWSIDAEGKVESLDWSTDEGFRVAYLVLGNIRVVTGDGLADVAVAPSPAGLVAPTWQPEENPTEAIHNLTFVNDENKVETTNTDSGRVLSRSRRFPTILESLTWDAAGERLLALSLESATVLNQDGEKVFEHRIKGRFGRAALSPDGNSLAVVSPSRRGTELSLVGDDGRVKRLFSSGRRNVDAVFGAPVFSPDGEWILLPWPEADQWLFVNTRDRRVTAVADISRQFDADGKGASAFPEIAGWCCAP